MPPNKWKFKRERNKKTDYNLRLKLLKSKKPRLVIRKSNSHINLQVIEFHPNGDRTIIAANSQQLKKFGWNFGCGNLPAAYLTGLIIGKAFQKSELVLDIGMQRCVKGSRIFAALKGVIDGGGILNYSKEILPSEDRIRGEHIANYLNKPQLLENFEQTKKKILSDNK